MHIINLRKHYPHYTEDILLEVSDEVYEVILLSIRQENNYKSRMYYHKAQYSAVEKADTFHSNEIKVDSVTVVIATPYRYQPSTKTLIFVTVAAAKGGCVVTVTLSQADGNPPFFLLK